MASSIVTIDAHVGGAPVRLVTHGVASPSAATFLERVTSLEGKGDGVRRLVTAPPRGYAALVGALVVQADDPADLGVVLMDAHGWHPRAAQGLMATAGIAVARQLLHPADAASHPDPGHPHTPLVLTIETVWGTLSCSVTGSAHGRSALLSLELPDAHVVATGVTLRAASRLVSVDVVDCHGRHLFVDSEACGVRLDLGDAHALRRVADALEDAYEEVAGPTSVDAVVFVGAASSGGVALSCAVCDAHGRVYETPTWSAAAGLAALLRQMDMLGDNTPLVLGGLAGTELCVQIARPHDAEHVRHGGIRACITGRVVITGDGVLYDE